MNNTKVILSGSKLNYACELMRALAHPLRLRILHYLDQFDDNNVNSIYKTLGIEQSVTSQHLKILREAGVVFVEQNGKFMHYTINYPVLEKAEYAMARYKTYAS